MLRRDPLASWNSAIPTQATHSFEYLAYPSFLSICVASAKTYQRIPKKESFSSRPDLIRAVQMTDYHR